MIPEKGSLFLCDWSKMKEKHHVNRITWFSVSELRDRVTVEIYMSHTEQLRRRRRRGGKFAGMKKGARFPLKLMFLWVNMGGMHVGTPKQIQQCTPSLGQATVSSGGPGTVTRGISWRNI